MLQYHIVYTCLKGQGGHGSRRMAEFSVGCRKCGWGGKLSLQNVGGGIVYIIYHVLTSQVYGGKSISKGANATPSP